MKLSSSVGIGFSVVCALVSVSCKSKFSESSPGVVNVKGLPLEERLAQKELVDSRIDEIQKVIEKIEYALKMFKKAQNSGSGADSYTVFNVISELNDEFNTKIPEYRNEKLIRYGKITIPIKTIPEECQKIESLLETDALIGQHAPNPISANLIYSVRGCGTNGVFSEALIAKWNGPTFELKIMTKPFELIFKDIVSKTTTEFNCQATRNSEDKSDVISCRDIDLRISSTTTAHIAKMTYSAKGETRFESEADIFENEKLSGRSMVKILKNGQVEIDFKQEAATASSL